MAIAVSYMSRETLSELLQTPSDSLAIIDVRDDDYIGGHIKGSMNVPSTTLDHRIPELVRILKDKEKVVFHCALSQQRGPNAAYRYMSERQRVLKIEMGGKEEGSEERSIEKANEQQVLILDGGFVKWQEKFVFHDFRSIYTYSLVVP